MNISAKILVVSLAFGLGACGAGTVDKGLTPGSQDVRSQSSSGTSTDNPMAALSFKVSGFKDNVVAKLCVQKTYLEPAVTQKHHSRQNLAGFSAQAFELPVDVGVWSQDSQQIVPQLYQALLDPKGSSLQSAQAVSGNYGALVLELGNACGTGKSLDVSNAKGQFSLSEPIQLRFKGPAQIRGKSASFGLDASAIANQIAKIENARDLASVLKNAEGSLVVERN